MTHLATLELDAASALQCRLERALTEWRRGRVDTALAVLRSLVAAVAHDAPTSALHSQVLSLYGQWLAETRAENPRRILAKVRTRSDEVFLYPNCLRSSLIYMFLSVSICSYE